MGQRILQKANKPDIKRLNKKTEKRNDYMENIINHHKDQGQVVPISATFAFVLFCFILTFTYLF